MTTREAIQAMLDGKKVRRITWSDHTFIYFVGKIFIDNKGEQYEFTTSTIEWELYVEPKLKKTVTIEKCIFRDSVGVICILDISRDTIKKYCYEFKMTKLKLLETYEVEL